MTVSFLFEKGEKGVFIWPFANKRKTQMFEVTDRLGKSRSWRKWPRPRFALGGVETCAEGNAFAVETGRAEWLSGPVLGLGPGDEGSKCPKGGSGVPRGPSWPSPAPRT